MGILNFTTEKINEILSDSVTHFSDTVKHITAAERTAWNGKAPSTYLGNMSRNKIYKIGYFFKGSGASSSGAVTIRIRNFTDYGNENYMLAFLGSQGFSVEYHGQKTTNYISKISVYSDPSVTGSAKKYTVFVTTQDYVDWASVYIDNEHSFTRNFADVTDTFSALVDGLDKVWESEYEYLNPPMQLGVEYRTTERYGGKPVYVKLVDCGNVASGAKTINFGYSDSQVFIISVHGVMKSSSGKSFTAPRNNGTDVVSCHSDGSGIVVWSKNSAYESYTINCLVKYTKTTD